MGSPQSPNATQYQELEKASELVAQAVKPRTARRASAVYELALPRQGVALLSIEAH
jgi:xylan 1,4-beta-xylosidase